MTNKQKIPQTCVELTIMTYVHTYEYNSTGNIANRKSLNVSTFQVSPTELENLIMEIPQVADVAVVGIPDTLAGEVPRAYVVKKVDVKITEDDIIKYVNPKVIHYKKLAGGVRFVNSIPRNPNGKILRNELKVIN